MAKICQRNKICFTIHQLAFYISWQIPLCRMLASRSLTSDPIWRETIHRKWWLTEVILQKKYCRLSSWKTVFTQKQHKLYCMKINWDTETVHQRTLSKPNLDHLRWYTFDNHLELQIHDFPGENRCVWEQERNVNSTIIF